MKAIVVEMFNEELVCVDCSGDCYSDFSEYHVFLPNESDADGVYKYDGDSFCEHHKSAALEERDQINSESEYPSIP